MAQPKGHRVQAELPVVFAYLKASGEKKNDVVVFLGIVSNQLRGHTAQGVTLVGEKEPTGHSGLQMADEAAGNSVDIPEGQGVQERADEDEL